MAENRGQGINLPSSGPAIGLPPRVFMYTLDQIGGMLNLSTRMVVQGYVYLEGRSIGARNKGLMVARNIAPPDLPPDWRIMDREFIRWMKFKGFRYYDRGTVSN